MRRVLSLLLLSFVASAWSAAIVPVGVLGNSGEFGATLLRAQGFDPAHAASGVAMDGDATLWVSAGDSIVQEGLDGRLIERFSLHPPGSSVDSSAFAVLDGNLYFLGWLPKRVRAVFSLPMHSGASANALALKLPEQKHPNRPARLSGQAWLGQLLLAADIKGAQEPAIAIYRLDPGATTLTQAFRLPGEGPESVVVDAAHARIYVGGRVVKGSDGYSPGVAALKFADAGFTIDFVAASIPLPATPSWFNGRVSFTAGAFWDVSEPYGFVARLNREFQGAPGVVGRWLHELDQTTQIIGLSSADTTPGQPQPLLIATNVPDACYLAEWDAQENQFRLTRRFGSLPRIASLGLSDQGWVTVGTAHTQLWWRWDDDASAPPRMGDMSVAATSGFFQGDRFFAFGAIKDLSELERGTPVPLVFAPVRIAANSAARPTQGQPLGPIKRPVGVGVQLTAGKQTATLFVVDGAAKGLYRAPIFLPDMRVDPARIEAVAMGQILRTPTDVVPLADGRLLLADEGRVLLLKPRDQGFGIEWEWDNKDGAGGVLGKTVRMAAHGDWLLVSDTERHRVLWVDWQQRKVLAQFGETDKAGDDTRHLNGPTFVALQATRGVIADAGNQRILRVELRP